MALTCIICEIVLSLSPAIVLHVIVISPRKELEIGISERVRCTMTKMFPSNWSLNAVNIDVDVELDLDSMDGISLNLFVM